MVGTKGTRKVFQQVQLALLLKDMGIHFNTAVGRIDTRTSAASFLGMRRMGCRVRTQKEFGIPTGRCGHQGKTMHFGFQNRQTIEMRANASDQQIFGTQQ